MRPWGGSERRLGGEQEEEGPHLALGVPGPLGSFTRSGPRRVMCAGVVGGGRRSLDVVGAAAEQSVSVVWLRRTRGTQTVPVRRRGSRAAPALPALAADNFGAMFARHLGLLLLAVATCLLITAPRDAHAGYLLGFLGCVVPGVMLASGILGRRGAPGLTALPASRATPVAILAPREFRYPRPGVGALLMLALLLALNPALALFVLLEAPAGMRGLVWLFIGLGMLLPLYLRAHYSQSVTIDEVGMRARGYLRTVALRWDDVIALEATEVGVIGVGSAGSIYRVRGRSGTIRYFGSLVGAAELCASVSAATGRAWG